MTVVSIVNRKGGVGKTTLTLALADFLSAVYGKKILLVDLDPQANLSLGCLSEGDWDRLDRAQLTVADVFSQMVDGLPPRVHLSPVNRIARAPSCSLLCSTPRLADREAEAMESDQAWRRRVGSPYVVLHQALAPHFAAYDYVLVDCPPSLGVVTLNGLAMSHGYLVPVMPSAVALAGVKQLHEKIRTFSTSLGRSLKGYGTIVNRVNARTNSHNALIKELEGNALAKPIWTNRIAQTARAEEGWMLKGQTTLVQRWGTLYAPLAALAEEFIRRVR